jgi:hypothetical protein
MIPANYRHAVESGVYLQGVDSSSIGDRLRVEASEIGAARVLLTRLIHEASTN